MGSCPDTDIDPTTAESFIRIMRIKEMIANPKSYDC